MTELFARLQQLLSDRYRLERELGGGGMALVFLAEDLKHRRPVAIKVLRPEFSITLGAERFLREIEVVARLQHPHILPLLDSGAAGVASLEWEGNPSRVSSDTPAEPPSRRAAEFLYFVMPYVEGDSLRGRLAREGRLPIPEVIRILADVADALGYAHEKGIVHRDIKPDNVMLTGRHAVVMDFGVAKAVSAAAVAPLELTAGVALGTPAYMAPEQATADPALDHRVDLYALGVLGYELLAGRPPFTGATAHELLTAHVLDDPDPVETVRPEVPPALATILMRCLAKKPADRYADAREVLALLEPMLTPSGGITPTALPPVASRATWRGLAWASLTALAVIGAVLYRGQRRAGGSDPLPAPRQVSFHGGVLNGALSPDGLQMALVVQEGDSQRVLLLELRGGDTRPLANEGRVLQIGWNQEGTEVWYLLYRDSSYSVRRVGRLGGAPRTVATFGAVPSPDGRWGANWDQRRRTLLRIDLASGDSVVLPPRPVNEFGDFPTWSPRSDRVALVTFAADRVHYALIVGRFGPEPGWSEALVDSVGLSQPTWDARGEGLYYLRDEGAHASLYHLALDPTGHARGAPVPIRRDFTDRAETTDLPPQLSLSANGSRLTYVQSRRWTNLEWTRVAPDDGPVQREPLTTGTSSHSGARLSPDGATLAFIRTESEVSTIMLMRLADRIARPVATPEALSELAWSPDGRYLAVSTVRADSGGAVDILDPGGGPARRSLVGPVGFELTWGPDAIYYQVAHNQTVRRLDPVTGAASGVPGVPDSLGWVFSPRVSPDAQWLALAWNRRPLRGLWLVSLQDGRGRRLTDRVLDPLAWSRDGAVIYAARGSYSGEPAELWSVPSAGGAGHQLVRYTIGDKVEDILPDGSAAILSHEERRADAWMLELPAVTP